MLAQYAKQYLCNWRSDRKELPLGQGSECSRTENLYIKIKTKNINCTQKMLDSFVSYA